MQTWYAERKIKVPISFAAAKENSVETENSSRSQDKESNPTNFKSG